MCPHLLDMHEDAGPIALRDLTIKITSIRCLEDNEWALYTTPCHWIGPCTHLTLPRNLLRATKRLTNRVLSIQRARILYHHQVLHRDYALRSLDEMLELREIDCIRRELLHLEEDRFGGEIEDSDKKTVSQKDLDLSGDLDFIRWAK